MKTPTNYLTVRITLIFLIITASLNAQDINRVVENDYSRSADRKIMHIPDIQGYKTLKGDFHMHTVFSDGHVWPESRVMEAWREGLDVIAITDHIEHLPHKDHLVSDHNTPYEVAREKALAQNIILIRGTEITRKMPPGHFNALFLEDVNPVENEDPMKQLEEAARQGAFLLWNHPGWASQQPDSTIWWDMHTEILENGWIHGVEVANSGEWYPIVLDWCREKELTVFSNSDIHAAIDFDYDLSLANAHRPMTLVFAKDRSEAGVKEALFSRRTLGFFGNQLVGPEDLILDLFNASIIVHTPFMESERKGKMVKHIEIENPTDLTFILERDEENGKNKNVIELNPHSEIILTIPADEDTANYRLINCWSGSDYHPVVRF
jgi:hypothetical protein